MEFFRSKNTAVKCKFLTRIAMAHPSNSACAHASFACSNKEICSVPNTVLVVTFDSLDFCCTCKNFSDEQDK